MVSEVLPSGEILELVYREKYREVKLAIFDGKKVRYEDHLERPHEILLPFSAANELITKKVILLPSEDENYGSNKDLYARIRGFIHRYVDISPSFEAIAAYYVMFSWVYDRFGELAYLRALGEYGSGKSRLIQTIGSLCYKPMFAGGATTVSPIFRIIDAFRGTLILDEADYKFSDTTAEIAKILNSGYQKGSPVLRSEGNGKFEIKSYDVFCPKIIATRKHFDDIALESRFLIEELDKKELRQDIPLNLPASFWDDALRIRNQLLCWRFSNFASIELKAEDLDRTLEPRLNQIVMPLLSIIEDPEMRDLLKATIKTHNDRLVLERGMSFEAEIFQKYLNCLMGENEEPTVGNIAEDYNLGMKNSRDYLTSRRMGDILRKQLKLVLRRTNEGTVVSQAENKSRIEALKRKYGFVDSVNEVNEVNVVNVAEEVAEEMPPL